MQFWHWSRRSCLHSRDWLSLWNYEIFGDVNVVKSGSCDWCLLRKLVSTWGFFCSIVSEENQGALQGLIGARIGWQKVVSLKTRSERKVCSGLVDVKRSAVVIRNTCHSSLESTSINNCHNIKHSVWYWCGYWWSVCVVFSGTSVV